MQVRLFPLPAGVCIFLSPSLSTSGSLSKNIHVLTKWPYLAAGQLRSQPQPPLPESTAGRPALVKMEDEATAGLSPLYRMGSFSPFLDSVPFNECCPSLQMVEHLTENESDDLECGDLGGIPLPFPLISEELVLTSQEPQPCKTELPVADISSQDMQNVAAGDDRAHNSNISHPGRAQLPSGQGKRPFGDLLRKNRNPLQALDVNAMPVPKAVSGV